MKRKKLKKRISPMGLVALYAAGTALAAEQQPGTAPADQVSGELAEVTVTARRRAENVQDVPIAVTVLNPETLKANNVQSMEDLQYLTPSLSFVSTQDRNNPTVTIRGQGPSPGAGPSVVFYLDEVPLPALQTGGNLGGPGFYYDLENIQILKGPQGTLFGRNTTGGAILVQSARPKDDFEGHIQVAGGNYGDRELDAALNVPIVADTLLARVAVSTQERNGFTNIVGQPDRAEDDVNRTSGRVSITYKPIDSVQNDFIYNFSNLRNNGTSIILAALDPNGAAAQLYPGIVTAFREQQALGVHSQVPTDWYQFMERKYYGVTDIFRFNITPDVMFRNIFGYSHMTLSEGVDGDGTNFPIFEFSSGVPVPIHFNTYTEEPQLQGTALHGNLTWVVGAFYLNSPPGNYGASVTSILGSPDRLLTRLGTHSEALYTQETYDLSSLVQGLKFTGGFRYTWDHQFAQQVSLDGDGVCVSTLPNHCTTTGNADFKAPTYTLDVDYQLTHGTMLYLASRRGYRDGGFNTNSNIATSVDSFGPEHVTDYEFGTKSEWQIGGVRARTNGDVYVEDYQGIQVPVITEQNGNVVQLTQNGADARISGLEFEGIIFPTQNFELGATFSWINFAYTSSQSGAQLTQAHEFPKTKYGVSAKYHLPLAPQAGDFSLGANWGWQAHSYVGPLGDPAAPLAPYGLLNLSADWEHIGRGPLDASFFMTNATNKVYAVNDWALYAFTGTSAITYGLPRMYGVRVNYRFGAEK